MNLSCLPYQLKFRHPFAIAAGVRNHTDIVIVKLQFEGFTGYGEASLPPYLKENTQTVTAFLKSIEPGKLKDFMSDFENTLLYVDDLEIGNHAAKAAIDIALHDLRGKIAGKTVGELYGIEPKSNLQSTYTIGISSFEDMKDKLNDASGFQLIKLKLGSKNDKELVANYLRLSAKPFCVDVNQGWKSKEEALEIANWLAEKRALFIEQPMPKELLEEAAWLNERSPVPVIADEAVQRLDDINRIKEAYSGINIKLMKSTGILEAVKMIRKARSEGLKVLVGCMAESSCAVTAAAHLAPLADWADLDGPQLILNDPFKGIEIKEGRVKMPVGSGLGVELITSDH